jgi:hypothetical protein
MGYHSHWLVRDFALHMIRFKPLEDTPMKKKPAPKAKPSQKPMPAKKPSKGKKR